MDVRTARGAGWLLHPALCVVVLLAAGCGFIADKDRIVVARMGDETITRGDLFRVIREMPDKERPIIRNKGDLLRALNQYIDDEIKGPMGRELRDELSEEQMAPLRARAREQVFQENEDLDYRQIYAMEVPADGQATPAMEAYDISARGLRNMKDLIEDRTDIVLEDLLGELAVTRRAFEALEAGEITLDEEEIEAEFALRREDFQSHEWIKFRAIRFPSSKEGSSAAAKLVSETETNAAFEAAFERVAASEPQRVMRDREIENNPDVDKFAPFWRAVHGCEAGDLLAPVFLPEHEMVEMRGDQRRVVTVPAAFLALEVIDHQAAASLSLEQVLARQDTAQDLLSPLLYAQMIEHLREVQGVEIYEEQLPDVTMLGR
ncbi:MAG: hypothetical protein ACLFTT_12225 [Candidatus Hydrogenedentota bacterium]